MTKIKSQSELYGGRNKRIGILGGTFDPPHLAHTQMAVSAKDELNLDYVVFMPLGVPPHGKEGISSAFHRINMLELILNGNEDFFIDAYETKLDKPSYTVESAARINSVLAEGSLAYFIIGADSLLYLDKWYDAKTLLEIARFAVIPRQGYQEQECLSHIKVLKDNYGARIEYIKTEAVDLSSTAIRKGKSSETTIEVLEYINKYGLYKQ